MERDTACSRSVVGTSRRRSRVVSHGPLYLVVQGSTGEYADNVLFIPLIPLSPTDADLPFTLRRRQYSRPTHGLLYTSAIIHESMAYSSHVPPVFTQRPDVDHVRCPAMLDEPR